MLAASSHDRQVVGSVAARDVDWGMAQHPSELKVDAPAPDETAHKTVKSDDDWRHCLSPDQFRVLRQHGTERPGSSPLNYEKRSGVFSCTGCGQPLFSSDTKFESGTGWPSFWAPLPGAIATSIDDSHFMRRVEVHCSRCNGHLGHVFPDGPAPTGQRYCMNGIALAFQVAEK
jgi:peptide-methionine (R)-S-oxide reductase